MKKSFFTIGLFLFLGCTQAPGTSGSSGDTTGPAYSISLNFTVNSTTDVTDFFNANLDLIINKTLVSFNETDVYGGSFYYSERDTGILLTHTLLINHSTVEYKSWSGEMYWVSGMNYLLKIPIVPENYSWFYENNKVIVLEPRCVSPTGVLQILNGAECPYDLSEERREANEVRYIITDKGVIHYGGIVLRWITDSSWI